MSELEAGTTKNVLKTKQMSRSLLKQIKALTKNQLVDKLVQLHNYAETQKAMNMILMAKLNVVTKMEESINLGEK